MCVSARSSWCGDNAGFAGPEDSTTMATKVGSGLAASAGPPQTRIAAIKARATALATVEARFEIPFGMAATPRSLPPRPDDSGDATATSYTGPVAVCLSPSQSGRRASESLRGDVGVNRIWSSVCDEYSRGHRRATKAAQPGRVSQTQAISRRQPDRPGGQFVSLL